MSTLREELLKFLYEKDIRYLWKLHDKASLFGLFKKPDKEGGTVAISQTYRLLFRCNE